ncbi:hypothetical protein BKA80DRAFT_40573 [Phyllosticta citrichinensis]
MRPRGTKAVEPHVEAGTRQLCLPALVAVDYTLFDQASTASSGTGVQRVSMASKVLDIDSTWADARGNSWKGSGTCIEGLDFTIEGEVPWQGTAHHDPRDGSLNRKRTPQRRTFRIPSPAHPHDGNGRKHNLETPVDIPNETQDKGLGRWLQPSRGRRALR